MTEQDHSRDLAMLAAAAGFVDAPLLRHLRRHCLTADADARAEADVWWSPDVEYRGVNGIVFRAEALDAMRDRLASDVRRDAAIAAVSHCHAGGPALLVLEEQLIAMALRESPAGDLEARLAAAVQALDDATRSAEVLGWAERSLTHLPRAVRATTSAWALALAVQQRVGVEVALEGGADVRWDQLARWLPSGGTPIEIGVRGAQLLARASTSSGAVLRVLVDELIYGTAFLVSPTLAVTAGHVVDGARPDGRIVLLLDEDVRIEAHIAFRASRSDWLLLECQAPVERPAFRLARGPAPANRPWTSRGATGGRRELGILSGTITTGHPLAFMHDTPGATRGASGAPIVVDGVVVGVLTERRGEIGSGPSITDMLAEWPASIPLPAALPTINVPPTHPPVVLVGEGGPYRMVRLDRVEATLGEAARIQRIANLRGEVWTVGLTGAPTPPRPLFDLRELATIERSADGMTARAYAGDGVTMLALDVALSRRRSFRGFDLRRDGEPVRTGDWTSPPLLHRFWWFDRDARTRHRYEIAGTDVAIECAGQPEGPIRVSFDSLPHILEFLDDCYADAGSAVDVFAYDLDHPDIRTRFARLGSRLRIVLDNSKKHLSSFEQMREELTRAGCQVFNHHYRGAAHVKALVRRRNGLAISVLTGSANYTESSLGGQRNYIVRLDDPAVAACHATWFEWATTGRTPPQDIVTAGNIDIAMSPSRIALDMVIGQIERAKSSVLFSLYETSNNRVIEAVLRARKQANVLVAGLLYSTSDLKVVWGEQILTIPLPRPRVITAGHGRYLAIDFNQLGARAVVGSSTFSTASEKNGENTLVIRDERVATTFAVEALAAIDHNRFRGATGRELQELARDEWWKPYFVPGNTSCRMRELLMGRAPKPVARARAKKKKPVRK